MRGRKGVDSILLENIAESEKSITDEVIELSQLFLIQQPRQIFFSCVFASNTPSIEVSCFMSRWTCSLHSHFYYCFVFERMNVFSKVETSKKVNTKKV